MDIKHTIYVHYGHKEFDLKSFKRVSNREAFVKPFGGLWGSPIDSEYGWKQWVDDNDFNDVVGNDKYVEDNKFYFTLKPFTRLLYISNSSDLIELPKLKNKFDVSNIMVTLDFEKIRRYYDAVEVSISSDRQLYWDLYGWDVDSVLILNPECVQPLDESEVENE